MVPVRTMFLMHSLNLPDELANSDNRPVELV